MICVQCQATNRDGTRFCRRCGAFLPAEGQGAGAAESHGVAAKESHGAVAEESRGAAAEESHGGAAAEESHGGAAEESRGAAAEEPHGGAAEESHGAVAEESRGATAEESHGVAAEESHGVGAEESHGVAAGQTPGNLQHGQEHRDQAPISPLQPRLVPPLQPPPQPPPQPPVTNWRITSFIALGAALFSGWGGYQIAGSGGEDLREARARISDLNIALKVRQKHLEEMAGTITNLQRELEKAQQAVPQESADPKQQHLAEENQILRAQVHQSDRPLPGYRSGCADMKFPWQGGATRTRGRCGAY